MNVLRRLLLNVPVETAAMGTSGEEELRLAQGKSLRDPRPDIPHLLGTDNLRGEGVRVQSQLHVPSMRRDENTVGDASDFKGISTMMV